MYYYNTLQCTVQHEEGRQDSQPHVGVLGLPHLQLIQYEIMQYEIMYNMYMYDMTDTCTDICDMYDVHVMYDK